MGGHFDRPRCRGAGVADQAASLAQPAAAAFRPDSSTPQPTVAWRHAWNGASGPQAFGMRQLVISVELGSLDLGDDRPRANWGPRVEV